MVRPRMLVPPASPWVVLGSGSFGVVLGNGSRVIKLFFEDDGLLQAAIQGRPPPPGAFSRGPVVEPRYGAASARKEADALAPFVALAPHLPRPFMVSPAMTHPGDCRSAIVEVSARLLGFDEDVALRYGILPRTTFHGLEMRYGGKSLRLEARALRHMAKVDATTHFHDVMHHSVGLFEALVAFRQQGLVHLDITTLNIVRDPDTRSLLLIDFGLASRAEWNQRRRRWPPLSFIFYPPDLAVAGAVRQLGCGADPSAPTLPPRVRQVLERTYNTEAPSFVPAGSTARQFPTLWDLNDFLARKEEEGGRVPVPAPSPSPALRVLDARDVPPEQLLRDLQSPRHPATDADRMSALDVFMLGRSLLVFMHDVRPQWSPFTTAVAHVLCGMQHPSAAHRLTAEEALAALQLVLVDPLEYIARATTQDAPDAEPQSSSSSPGPSASMRSPL